MTVTKTVLLSAHDQWLEAFPAREAQRAAQFLYEIWEELVTARPKAFTPKLRENKITETLGLYLRKSSVGKARLTGFWNHEVADGDLDEDVLDDVKVIKRIRKDIVYESNAGYRLTLIFEFKKLKATKASCKTYSGEEGMRRFVDGNYASGLPLAVMVGMLIGDRADCIDMLRRSILSVAGKTDLRLVPDTHGSLIIEPSRLFPDLATFDTEHNRPLDRAPSHGTMLLSHMFLIMP